MAHIRSRPKDLTRFATSRRLISCIGWATIIRSDTNSRQISFLVSSLKTDRQPRANNSVNLKFPLPVVKTKVYLAAVARNDEENKRGERSETDRVPITIIYLFGSEKKISPRTRWRHRGLSQFVGRSKAPVRKTNATLENFARTHAHMFITFRKIRHRVYIYT